MLTTLLGKNVSSSDKLSFFSPKTQISLPENSLGKNLSLKNPRGFWFHFQQKKTKKKIVQHHWRN